jgi:hypothetical protein
VRAPFLVRSLHEKWGFAARQKWATRRVCSTWSAEAGREPAAWIYGLTVTFAVAVYVTPPLVYFAVTVVVPAATPVMTTGAVPP